jgi:uncharacterized protein (DUF433 family)
MDGEYPPAGGASDTGPALVRETVGGEEYGYYPLGRHVVSAPGVCDGRPTFRHTRVEVAGVLELLASGWSIQRVVEEYGRPEINREAVEEAVRLAAEALAAQAPAPERKAA